jgi:hypothetical protein
MYSNSSSDSVVLFIFRFVCTIISDLSNVKNIARFSVFKGTDAFTDAQRELRAENPAPNTEPGRHLYPFASS